MVDATTHRWSHVIRYFAGALLCAGINNVVLIGGDALALPLSASVFGSWFLGGVTGYVWHAKVTYRADMSLGGCGRFLAGAAAGVPLAWAVLLLFRQWLGWRMEIAAPVATVVLFFYNYVNARFAILKRIFHKPG